MSNTVVEIKTPEGRIVAGHPMKMKGVKDTVTNQPKMQADGITPRTESFIGLAIRKGGETHWNQTEWGAKIHQAGQEGWPNGEFNSPTFSWKITDGDSQIPNKKGKKPCDREGYPGNWIINLSTGIPLRCFHAGHYQPHEVIQNENEIKTGDYARVFIRAKGNAPSQSPGVYLNPELFELSRAGELIITESGADAVAVFGDGAAPVTATTPGGTIAPGVGVMPPAAPAAAVTPAPDFLNNAAPAAAVTPPAPTMYNVGGQQYTADALKQAGWTDAQIEAL